MRQERRRRMLTDESTQNVALENTSARASGAGKKETYTSAAARELQPRITDFVPLRAWTFAALLSVSAVLIGGLEALHYWGPELAGSLQVENLAALDFSSRQSLAHWFSAVLLALSALTAVLIFSLRRHRIDDLRGRYRVWLWVAIAAVLLSIDQTTSWHEVGHALLAPLASWSGLERRLLWGSCWGVVGATLVVRVLFEMRRSKGAVAMSLAALLSLGLAAAGERDWLSRWLDTREAMLAAGARLTGYVLLLCGLMLYARYVMLDAAGLLPGAAPKVKKVKRKKKPVDADGDETTSHRVDSAHKPKPHIAPRTDLDPAPARVEAKKHVASASHAKPSAASYTDDDDDDDDSSSDGRNLSRAERKRLRREQKKQTRGGDDE